VVGRHAAGTGADHLHALALWQCIDAAEGTTLAGVVLALVEAAGGEYAQLPRKSHCGVSG